MGEDFIRCYIGNVHFSMLAAIQRESSKFNEWELMNGSEFDLKHSYGYIESLIRDDSLLEALAKRSVIAETRQPASVKPSILWSNAPNIADVITLLSLARARYCSTLAVEKNLGTKYSIGWGLVTEEFEGNWDIVPISNLGGFITEAITYIENNHDWLDESGFTPSIFWYEQAQKSYHTAPSVLEMGLYWVSLEILASTYIDAQGIAINNKKDRVKRFITDRGYTGSNWDFLEEVINDWYQTRCFLFHEGKQSLPRNVLIKRRQQVRDFTSLVFVEMLKQQDEARKKHLATRMQKY